MFEFLSRHFWLIALVIGFVNYFMFKNKVRPLIEENPDLEPGYERLSNGLLLMLTVPWIIVGGAILSGEAKSIFDFLSPRQGSWPVQLFWVFTITCWMGGMAWIVFGAGAEFLAQHPGMIRINFPGVDAEKPTARQIRRSFIFFLIIGMVVFGLFLSGVFPPFNHGELPPDPSR